MTLAQIHEAIAVIAPIDGVDSTGRICFKDEATDEQILEATATMEELLPGLEA